MTKIIFIRHGQTTLNVARLIAGRGSDPALTEEGKNQAHRAGEALQEQFGSQIDTIIVSGMTRTNQTAEILNQYLNINNIYYNSNLQEKDYGAFEGKSTDEFLPYLYALDKDEPIPGGESDTMFKIRVIKVLCEHFLSSKETPTLYVSHGHFGKIAMREFFGEPKHFDNCEFVVIDSEQINDLAGKCNLGINIEL